jgi:hypothetical protein
VNGAGDLALLVRAANPFGPLVSLSRLVADKRLFELSIQEVAHPNQRGYAEETLSILRWSRSPNARDAVAYTRSAEAVDPSPTSWRASDVNLGLSSGSIPTLQGGTSYPLQAGGFAPDTTVELVVRSAPRVVGAARTDKAGTVRTRVPIPRGLAGGRHTLTVDGVGPDGKPRSVRIAFEVEGDSALPVQAALGAGSALLLLVGLVLVWLGRRGDASGRDDRHDAAPAVG